MQLDTVTKQIRTFLEKRFPLTRNIGSNDSLLTGGVLDSLGILELVAFIEEEFQIAVIDEELLPENFESIACLVAFVQSKRNSSTAERLEA